MSNEFSALALRRPRMTPAMRERVDAETRTSQVRLEARRDNLQVRILELEKMLALAHSDKLDERDRNHLITSASLFAMQGILEGIAYIADCVTCQDVIEKRSKKDGKLKEVEVRWSAAMMAYDMSLMQEGLLDMMGSVALMQRDHMLWTLDPARLGQGWWDENRLLRCPYPLPREKSGKKKPEAPPEEEPPESAELQKDKAERKAQEEVSVKSLTDKITREYREKLGDVL